MTGRHVATRELDDALEAGRVKLGRVNRRQVQCCVIVCREKRDPGHAWKLFLDGHYRGYVCEDCLSPGGLVREPIHF